MAILRARTSFVCPGHIHITEGQLVDSANPIVQGRAELFEPAEDFVARVDVQPVEVKKSVKKAAAKPAVATEGA